MTEDQWITSTDPQAMLEFLRTSGKLSERKARLFACAAVRRVWHLLQDEGKFQAIEVAEWYADGKATEDQRYRATIAAQSSFAPDFAVENPHTCFAADAAECVAAFTGWEAASADDHAAYAAASMGFRDRDFDRYILETERGKQCDLLRCIFASPFRPKIRLEPAWLTRNGDNVKRRAEDAYNERLLPSGHLDNARLAILADALEEAGCHDPEILGHLRQPELVHVRGCWALDCLLGKS